MRPFTYIFLFLPDEVVYFGPVLVIINSFLVFDISGLRKAEKDEAMLSGVTRLLGESSTEASTLSRARASSTEMLSDFYAPT